MRYGLSVLVICSVVLSFLPQASGLENDTSSQDSATTESIIGFTAPHQKALLGISNRGVIANIYVQEGSFVSQGQLLFSLDESVQQARLQMSQAAAESTIEIELAKARWDRANHNLIRIKQLEGSQSAASKELTDISVEDTSTRLEYERAKFEHEQAKRAYQRELAILNQLRSKAPFAGYVSQVLKESGELVDGIEGVVELAQLDPLTIAIDCPLSLAPYVQDGDHVRVTPTLDHWKARDGVVFFANKVADSASQTIRIKLSVDNADGAWPVGLKVVVSIPNQKVKNLATVKAPNKNSTATHSLVSKRNKQNKN